MPTGTRTTLRALLSYAVRHRRPWNPPPHEHTPRQHRSIGLAPAIVSELKETNALLKDQIALQRDLKTEMDRLRNTVESVRKANDVLVHQATSQIFTEVSQYLSRNQLTFEQTLTRIIDEELSFARFGDGEIRLMLLPEFNLGFQPNSPALMGDLRSVFDGDYAGADNLLVGFPHLFRNVWGSTVWGQVWPDLKPILPENSLFGDSHVTRPIFFKHLGGRGVRLWREVWRNKNVCIVRGEGSRFELIPELFDNIKSHRFIHTSAVDAYASFESLKQDLADDDGADIYLLAVGPVATIAASYLASIGKRAIDIGHISGSYRNINAGQPKPEYADRA